MVGAALTVPPRRLVSFAAEHDEEPMRIFAALLLVATVLVAPANPAHAQSGYPTRPIQLVVPVPPGGAADFLARTVGAKLADALGQSIVILNRGGAGGTIATASVAQAAPDGY